MLKEFRFFKDGACFLVSIHFCILSLKNKKLFLWHSPRHAFWIILKLSHEIYSTVWFCPYCISGVFSNWKTSPSARGQSPQDLTRIDQYWLKVKGSTEKVAENPTDKAWFFQWQKERIEGEIAVCLILFPPIQRQMPTLSLSSLCPSASPGSLLPAEHTLCW